jgi:hypothetical protein
VFRKIQTHTHLQERCRQSHPMAIRGPHKNIPR